MRRVHHVSGTEPFSLANIADIGDLSVNPIDLMDGLKRIEDGIAAIATAGAIPLTAGGDHLTTLPVLRAVARNAPVGMIHFDAHSDTNDRYFGDNLYTHGTPFRRAIEEGLLDPKRVVQIGIRGSIYEPDEHAWAVAQGIRIIYMEEFVRRVRSMSWQRRAASSAAARRMCPSTSTASTRRWRRAPARPNSAASRSARRRR